MRHAWRAPITWTYSTFRLVVRWVAVGAVTDLRTRFPEARILNKPGKPPVDGCADDITEQLHAESEHTPVRYRSPLLRLVQSIIFGRGSSSCPDLWLENPALAA